VFHGWRVVAACFVIATVAWALGTFGASVYLQAVTAAHGWPIADVAFAITLFYLVSALVAARGRPRHRSLGAAAGALPRHGFDDVGRCCDRPRDGALAALSLLRADRIGWAALSTTGIAATVAPWFERHQGPVDDLGHHGRERRRHPRRAAVAPGDSAARARARAGRGRRGAPRRCCCP